MKFTEAFTIVSENALKQSNAKMSNQTARAMVSAWNAVAVALKDNRRGLEDAAVLITDRSGNVLDIRSISIDDYVKSGEVLKAAIPEKTKQEVVSEEKSEESEEKSEEKSEESEEKSEEKSEESEEKSEEKSEESEEEVEDEKEEEEDEEE